MKETNTSKMKKKLKNKDKKESKKGSKLEERTKLRGKDRYIFPMWTIGVVVLLLAITNFTYINQLESTSTKGSISEAEKHVRDIERECKDALSQIVEDVYRSVEYEKDREMETNVRFSQFLTKEYPTTRGNFAIDVSKPKIELKNAYYFSYDVERYNRTKVMMPVYVSTQGKVHVAVVGAKFNYEKDIDLDMVVSTTKVLIENRLSKYVRDVEGRIREIFEDMLNLASEYMGLDRTVVSDALELSMSFEECCVFHNTTNKEVSEYLKSLNRSKLSKFSPAEYFLYRYGYNIEDIKKSESKKNESGIIVLDLSSYGEPFYFTSDKYAPTLHSVIPKRNMRVEPRIEVSAKNKIEGYNASWETGVWYNVVVSGGVFEISVYEGKDFGKVVFDLSYEYSKFANRKFEPTQIKNLSNVLGFYCKPTNESISESRELGGKGSFVLFDIAEGEAEESRIPFWVEVLSVCAEKEVVPVLRIHETNVSKIGVFVSRLISSGAWDFARFRYIQIACDGNYSSVLIGAAQRLKVLPGVRIVGKEFSGKEEITSLISNLSARGLSVHDLIDIWGCEIPEGHPYECANSYYEEMEVLDRYYPEFGYLSGRMPIMITSIPFDKETENTSRLYLYSNTSETPDGRFVCWRPWMLEDRVCIISAFFPLEGNENELRNIKEKIPEADRNEAACGGWTEDPSMREIEPATPCTLIIKSFSVDKNHANKGDVFKIKLTVENIGRKECIGEEINSFEYSKFQISNQSAKDKKSIDGLSIGAYGYGIIFRSGINLLPGERKEFVIDARFEEEMSCELYASARYEDRIYEYGKYLRIEISNSTPSAKLRIESLAWSETSPFVDEIVTLKIGLRNVGSAVAYTQIGSSDVETYPKNEFLPGIPGRYRIALVGSGCELRFGLGNELKVGDRADIELKIKFTEKMREMLSVRVVEEGLGYVDERPASEILVRENGEYQNSITSGRGPSVMENASKDATVCLLGCYQPAYAYYGIRGDVGFGKENEKENGIIYAKLEEPGEVLEYRMFVGGNFSELKIYALPYELSDMFGEVRANVYIDGIKNGEVSFDKREVGVQERRIRLSIPYGEHFVAIEYAGSEGEGFRLVGLSAIFDVEFRVNYSASRAHVQLSGRNVLQGFVAYEGISKIRLGMNISEISQIEILDLDMNKIAILNGIKKGEVREFDISEMGLVDGLKYYVMLSRDVPMNYEFSYDVYPLGYAIVDGRVYPNLDVCIEIE